MKAYRLFDIHTKQFFVFRDVIFHEDIFLFHTVPDLAAITDPFPHLVLPNPTLESLFPNPAPSTSHSLPLSDSPSPLPEPSSHTFIPPRRSTRLFKQPSYLRDYHCHLAFSSHIPFTHSCYPISQFLSYDLLSLSYKKFILSVSSSFEPQFYHQVV